MARIKYGQIGVGHGHATKIQAYRESREFEVIGIAEPDEELRESAQSHPAYKDLKWLSVEQLLNEPGLQVVGIESKVRDLLRFAEQAVAADKHIHLDKPAGTSLGHFQKILDNAARKHLAVQLGYMYRYNPGIVLLRSLLKNGWLGEPFEVHAVIEQTRWRERSTGTCRV